MTKENINHSGSDCKDVQSQTSVQDEIKKLSMKFDTLLDGFKSLREGQKSLREGQDCLEDSVNRLHRSIRQNRNSILDLEGYRENPRGNISMRGFLKGVRSLQDGISDAEVEDL